MEPAICEHRGPGDPVTQGMIYTFANCELDTDRLELRRDGGTVSVEPQVFEVLAYLVAHTARVVTREELVAQVWGHSHISDAALTTRLRDARRAIGDSGSSQSLIRTIRGRGYRFVGEVRQRDLPARAPIGGRPRTTPLIAGRRDERASLDMQFETALTGSRQLVIITGEPGIGKTTLIDDFLAGEAIGGRALVGRGRCVDQRGAVEPYMPVLEALAEMGSGEAGARVVETLARVAPTWLLQIPWITDDATLADARERAMGARPERMLREMTAALEELSDEVPLLLVIDDLHWSDDSTLELLTHVARADGEARLLILCASRPTERQAIHELIRELRPRKRCTELPLSLLAEEAIGEYVEQRWPGPDRRTLASALRERTDGNPLFMDCLVGSWIESGVLVQRDCDWMLQGDRERIAEVPDTLRELIHQDVGRLPPVDQRLLEAGSAVGMVFAAGIVAPATGISSEDAELYLEALAAQGRILEQRTPIEWPDGTISATFAFIHDLHRQILYESLSAGRRARLHRELVARLEAAYGARAGEHSAELAGHALAGRAADRAVGYLQLAAEQAASRGALREAAAHLSRGLELVDSGSVTEEPQRRELSLRAGLAGVLVALDGWGSTEAEHSYRRALELARMLDDRDLTAVLLYRFAGLYELRGEYRTSESLLAEALRIEHEPDVARVVETHELMACSLFHQGSFAPAAEHAEMALALYAPEQTYPDPAFEGEHPAVACYDWAGLAQWCLGEPDRALASIETALQLAQREGHIHGQASARIFAAHLHHLRREPELAHRHAEIALALAQERRVVYQVAAARIIRGWSLSALGQPENGINLIETGLGDHEATGARMDRPFFMGLLADALVSARRPEDAVAVADDALALVAADRPFYYEPELHRLHAVAALASRGTDASKDAEESLLRALAIAQERSARGFGLRVAVTLARLLRSLGSPSEALAVLQRSFGSFDANAHSRDLREAKDLIDELIAA